MAEPLIDDAEGDSTTAPTLHTTSRVSEYAATVGCSLVILFSARPHAGFLLPLWLPILLVWFLRMAWVAWRRPARRRAQGLKVLVLVGAMAVAALAHGRYESESRAQAQRVVDAVTAYHEQHGSYPADLAQVGLDAEALRRDWQLSYLNRDGRHRVVYAVEFTVFDAYVYDFDKPGWIYTAD